jgi:FkbM family methyltransferase
VDYAQILHGADRVGMVLRRAGLGRLTRAARSVLAPRSITVSVDGFKLSGGVEHRGYLYRCAHGNVEELTRRLYREAVAPGMLVLDIGAYLGLYSLIAARELGGGGSVLAFEPDPRTFPRLVENIAMNRLTGRIAALQEAVSDSESERSFLPSDNDPSQSRLLPRGESQGGVPTACVTADALLASDARVDVIKLDVEGAELDALRGMARTLEFGSDFLTLFLEVHPDALRTNGQSGEAVVAEVEAAGFSIELIDEAKAALRPVAASDLLGKPVHLRCTRA